VFVDNGSETSRDGRDQNVVKRGENYRVNATLGIHIPESKKIDPHMLKTGLTYALKVRELERSIDPAIPDAIVTQNIDATPEPFHGLERRTGLTCRNSPDQEKGSCREAQQHHDTQNDKPGDRPSTRTIE
jgi:hypothetical protein